MSSVSKHKASKIVSYNKWGYIFILPFFAVFIVSILIPQGLTFYYSFFEYFKSASSPTGWMGPKFVGLQNFITMFTPTQAGVVQILKYFLNTIIMWIMGAVPQIFVALLLAVFFTSYRLNIKGQRFFKTVIYMPNLIMASAFSMLFFTVFSEVGPVNQILMQIGGEDARVDFLFTTISCRTLIALMNFLMWFGNSTLVLMSGIMGIDQSLFEASSIDGANSLQTFFRVTLPLLKPILIYCVITAMIGGLQMFDVPQILTNRSGTPNETTFTLMMWLSRFIGTSKNYGMGGAISVIMFIISTALSLVVFKFMVKKED